MISVFDLDLISRTSRMTNTNTDDEFFDADGI